MSERGDRMDARLTESAETERQPGSKAAEGERVSLRFDRETRDLPEAEQEVVFDVEDLSVYYGDFRAIRNITLPIYRNQITALIGPSGCGKTTFIRCLNRMNDLIEGARVEGKLLYHGVDLYDDSVDPVEVRRRIGMVFQKPNPFPKSVYDNISFGPKIAGFKGNMDDLVEESLRPAARWGEG
jgi:phosphate transport system ATP-binding protein